LTSLFKKEISNVQSLKKKEYCGAVLARKGGKKAGKKNILYKKRAPCCRFSNSLSKGGCLEGST
jgi:hypothetical protein